MTVMTMPCLGGFPENRGLDAEPESVRKLRRDSRAAGSRRDVDERSD